MAEQISLGDGAQVVPIVDEGLGNSSYVLDLGDGRAVVVDPGRDPSPYRAQAERRGLTIAWVLETHLHADFVSGALELARDGAQIVAPAAGDLSFPHRGLAGGDEVDLGGLTVRALATPGHSPEHLSYLVLEGEEPRAVFSGGALIVGSVARTDLITPEQTEPLARALWRALHDTLLPLPDDVAVLPTHGAGSFCSAPAGDERTTTIGRERATNPLLAARDEDDFVRRLLDSLGTFPDYFLRLREVNRAGPRVYGDAWPALEALAPEAVREAVDDGAELIDAREIDRFAAEHIPGALSIELRPSFASWLGWVVDPDRPLLFVLDHDQDRRDLVRQCLTIGYEHIAGELAGGVDAWRAAGLPTTRTPWQEPGELEREIQAGRAVLDVRQRDEFTDGHIPSARHVELGSLPEQTARGPNGPVTVVCEHGQRSMTGASVLERAGREDLAVLRGGTERWREEDRPLERA